jgi:hypothetical protein
MTEFILSAKNKTGKTVKIKIQSSTLDAAVQKAEKSGYSEVQQFSNGSVKTESLGNRSHANRESASKSFLTRLLNIHWSIRYGALLIVLIAAAGFLFKDKEDKQRTQIRAIAFGLGGEKYGEAYYGMARMMPSNAGSTSSDRTARGRESFGYNSEEFKKIVKGDLERQISSLSKKIDSERLYKGYWVNLRSSNIGEVFSFHKFSKGGKGEAIIYDKVRGGNELQRESFGFTVDGGKIKWKYGDGDDEDEIESMSDQFMILNELNGKYTCWMNVPSL